MSGQPCLVCGIRWRFDQDAEDCCWDAKVRNGMPRLEQRTIVEANHG